MSAPPGTDQQGRLFPFDMPRMNDSIARWVAREILPHEGRVRAWLSRQWRGNIDVDDIIQEAYCRLAALASVDHIDSPIAYFRKVAHAAAVDAIRRTKKNNVISMTEIEWFDVMDDSPGAERILEGKHELGRVRGLFASLSETCRRVIELRRVEGLSQKETAERLGVSENVVENNVVRGIRRVLKIMAEQDGAALEDQPGRHEKEREVARIVTSRLH